MHAGPQYSSPLPQLWARCWATPGLGRAASPSQVLRPNAHCKLPAESHHPCILTFSIYRHVMPEALPEHATVTQCMEGASHLSSLRSTLAPPCQGAPHLNPRVSCAGAIAAVFVGAATLGSSLRAGATLLAFYVSSSKLTTLKEELKDVGDEFKKGGQRDWVQVGHVSLCCACRVDLAISTVDSMTCHMAKLRVLTDNGGCYVNSAVSDTA